MTYFSVGKSCYKSQCDDDVAQDDKICQEGSKKLVGSGGGSSCLTFKDLFNVFPAFGEKSGQEELAPCEDPSCIDCRKDATKCVCKKNEYFYVDKKDTTRTCYKKLEEVKEGFGKKRDSPEDYELIECPEGCSHCSNSAKSCQRCHGGRYLNQDLSSGGGQICPKCHSNCKYLLFIYIQLSHS